MKKIKYLLLSLICSIFIASVGADAASYTEFSVINIDVPGWGGVATVPGQEYSVGGYQYAQTTQTIDKVNQGSRSTSARVQAMFGSGGYSSWTYIPNGGGYKSLGNFDSNYFKLQLKENTWSALGFYWFGKWKIPV